MASTPRRILVATDFSPTAERAEQVALSLSRRLGAELHIVHARVILEDPLMAEEQQIEIEQLLASADASTQEAFERTRSGDPPTPTQTHLVRSLSAAEAIIETAGDIECDLVVMGTHGRRGFKHMILGSVAERVVRSVSVPVLTVRPEADMAADGPKRILVTHDFSDRSAVAIRTAGAWADAFGAEITLLHVVEPVVYPEFYAINVLSDDVMTRLRDRATEALDRASEEILGNRPVSTLVLVGRAVDTIVTEARPDNTDLVVMGTRGLSGLEHIVLGSVAEGVMRRCPVPLLTVSEES